MNESRADFFEDLANSLLDSDWNALNLAERCSRGGDHQKEAQEDQEMNEEEVEDVLLTAMGITDDAVFSRINLAT